MSSRWNCCWSHRCCCWRCYCDPCLSGAAWGAPAAVVRANWAYLSISRVRSTRWPILHSRCLCADSSSFTNLPAVRALPLKLRGNSGWTGSQGSCRPRIPAVPVPATGYVLANTPATVLASVGRSRNRATIQGKDWDRVGRKLLVQYSSGNVYSRASTLGFSDYAFSGSRVRLVCT